MRIVILVGAGEEAEIEVRRTFDPDGFEQGPAIERLREPGLPA